jgi:aminotransferase in exopolysaccharide biosynthesis
MFDRINQFIRELYNKPEGIIPLHEPCFSGNEKKYITETIDSTFVSSVGEFVNQFEKMMCEITGGKYAVATVNGTSALHIALLISGVKKGDEVITQPLSFIATSNAISYTGAVPVFLDVDIDTLGLSPGSLRQFLESETFSDQEGNCINRQTGKRISACVPMHTFGFPVRIDEILEICRKHNITVIEDAAESLGSKYKGKHTGTFGELGIFSFNGNKIVTCGGGGCLITDNKDLARKAKHITTTAKIPHQWEYNHDEIGYNYRLPNLNAALACAQLEKLEEFIKNKKRISLKYQEFFNSFPGVKYFSESEESETNHWLNTICFESPAVRNQFLKVSNEAGVKTRPIWVLTNKLPMYKHCQAWKLKNAEWLEERVVNIPSSVIK